MKKGLDRRLCRRFCSHLDQWKSREGRQSWQAHRRHRQYQVKSYRALLAMRTARFRLAAHQQSVDPVSSNEEVLADSLNDLGLRKKVVSCRRSHSRVGCGRASCLDSSKVAAKRKSPRGFFAFLLAPFFGYQATDREIDHVCSWSSFGRQKTGVAETGQKKKLKKDRPTRSAGSRYDSLGSTRAAKKKCTRAAALARKTSQRCSPRAFFFLRPACCRASHNETPPTVGQLQFHRYA